MSYCDHFDEEEFKLFRKFNNKYERQGRHLDLYMLDKPDMTDQEKADKMKKNEENMIRDIHNQVGNMADYFKNDTIDPNDKPDQKCDCHDK